MPSALAEASPLADARNVHDLNSSIERVTRAEEYVNSWRLERCPTCVPLMSR